MIAVPRPSRFLRGVAHHCAFLLASRAFERRVQIQNLRRTQHRPRRCRKVLVEPGHARRFVHPCACASRRILQDEFHDAQHLGVDAILANRRDLRVAVVPARIDSSSVTSTARLSEVWLRW